MKIALSALLFCLFSSFVQAQQSIPVFATPADEILFKNVQQELLILRTSQTSTEADKAKLDSLSKQMSQLLVKITGYRYIYTKSKEAVSWLAVDTLDASAIKHLSIHDYSGKKLPRQLWKCSNLQTLELVNTSLKTLPRKLNKISSLKNLTILNNRPAAPLRLAKNRSATKLVIRSERPDKLPKTYKNWKNLECLDLSRCELTQLPDIGSNSRLKQLILSENKLMLSQYSFPKLEALEELNLQKNKIKELPASIAEFRMLKKLLLSYNELTVLPDNVGDLSSLEQLTLYQNKLNRLPQSFYNLKSLQDLDLYYNDLTRVSDSISNLGKLEILYLSFNQLQSVPASIGKLINLRELYLHHNNLSYLPDEIVTLNNLRVLRINDNSFVSFPYALLSLPLLETLDLSRNRFSSLPAQLEALSSLQVVSIAQNPWETKEEVDRVVETLREKGVLVHTSLISKVEN